MRSLRCFVFASLVTLPTLALAGCFGNEGDVCQVAADCHTDFICCKRYGSVAGVHPWEVRGTCEPMAMCLVGATDGGPRDFGVGTDSGLDAGSDLGTDAGNDAGDDAGTDAGADAGDAGDDAGADAGADAGDAGDTDAALDADVDGGP